MKFLLDTQAFLWFVLNDRALSQVARDLIIDPLNDILLSPASYFEFRLTVLL
jgi:PIN domain nuclease of toxin-antitoxin system